MKIVAHTWGWCYSCNAEPVRPLPEGWTYTVKRGRNGIDKVTVHRENCPRGFKKVFVPDVDE